MITMQNQEGYLNKFKIIDNKIEKYSKACLSNMQCFYQIILKLSKFMKFLLGKVIINKLLQTKRECYVLILSNIKIIKKKLWNDRSIFEIRII